MQAFVGIDVHRRQSQIAVMDEGGRTVVNRNVPNGREAVLGVIGDDFVLSFERGACKPDPAIFHTALDRLGVQAHEALMVGDRSGHDGAAVEAGITTLLVPPLTHVTQKRLRLVLAACGVVS
jgi:HAD superfamily hydrolase (TIGR01493 family)